MGIHVPWGFGVRSVQGFSRGLGENSKGCQTGSRGEEFHMVCGRSTGFQEVSGRFQGILGTFQRISGGFSGVPGEFQRV